MCGRWSSLLVVLVMVSALPCQESAGNISAFESGLKGVQRLMQRTKWKAAREKLNELLKRHAQADYVFSHQREILDWSRRCAFHLTFKTPTADSVVAGKVLKWSPSSGKIKLRYTRSERADFERSGNLLIHPLNFTGPYSIQIKGSRYPVDLKKTPEVLVGLSKNQVFKVIFGERPITRGSEKRWLPAKIIRYRGKVSDELFSKEISIARPGKPYRLSVKVGRGEIVAAINGRTFARAPKPHKLFAHLAFSAPHWSEVVIQGQAEPSWIQTRQDRALQRQREKFRRVYRPEKVLPAWLFKTAPRRPAAPRSQQPDFPPDVAARQRAAFRKAAGLLLLHQFARGIAYLKGTGTRELPASARHYLLARFQLAQGQPDAALAEIQRCLSLTPAFFKGQALWASILGILQRKPEALAAWRQVMELYPQETIPYEESILLWMVQGRMPKARRTLDLARKRGLRSARLMALDRMQALAKAGPVWGHATLVRSAHYSVSSDMDRATCTRAAELLEEALQAYRVHLKDVKPGKQRFKVYLFWLF